MKKTISLVLVLMLCVALAVPAMADFVPSVTYDGVAGSFLVKAEVGGIVTDAQFGEEDVTDLIIVTNEQEAKDKATDIPQEERDLLLDAIKQVAEGTMTLPLAEGFAVREIVCVDFIKSAAAMAEKLKEEGVTLTVTFDLGVVAEAELAVFSLIDGTWIEAASVANNGDGTVTVVFEDICPVVFAIKE